jgi:hypothetical protein
MRRWLWAILIGGGLTACQAPRAPTGQADPGAEGNGVEAQPGPYLVPPEASGLLGDAPAGFVSPPSLYESSVYPGWRFQYWLYVPAQYVSDSPAALMVFQDGGVNYIDFLRTPTVRIIWIAPSPIEELEGSFPDTDACSEPVEPPPRRRPPSGRRW